jgi:hypothetical protein
MKHLYTICVFAVITCACLSCRHSTEPGAEESSASSYFQVKYDSLFHSGYQQSMMLTGYSGKLLVLGCWFARQYDTTAKTWQDTVFPRDTVYNRWDGALAKFGNYLYVFGSPEFNVAKFRKVVKYDLNTLHCEMLSEPLPTNRYEPYPAYAETGNKILIVYPRLDSVYLFDSATEKGKFVAANELKDDADESVDTPYYAFGKYGNYLYIYGKTKCRLKRIDLTTYAWEEISIPQETKNSLAEYTASSGALFNGLLLLFRRTSDGAIAYDIASNKWGTSNYDKSLYGFFETRFTSDNAFYFVNIGNVSVMKITRVK